MNRNLTVSILSYHQPQLMYYIRKVSLPKLKDRWKGKECEISRDIKSQKKTGDSPKGRGEPSSKTKPLDSLGFPVRVKKCENIIDLCTIYWVLLIIKFEFRNIYICWNQEPWHIGRKQRAWNRGLIHHRGAVALTPRRIGKLQSTSTRKHQSPSDGK